MLLAALCSFDNDLYYITHIAGQKNANRKYAIERLTDYSPSRSFQKTAIVCNITIFILLDYITFNEING